MSVSDFAGHSAVLHAMTVDFVRAVPDDRWHFRPVPPATARPAPGRIGDGFGSMAQQVRHLVNVRGVYNDALTRGAVDWSRVHEHYGGSLDRSALLDALEAQQERLVGLLAAVDPGVAIDWGGFTYTFDLFAGEFVQHESIHHGQWSLYAALGGFDEPASWRDSWGL